LINGRRRVGVMGGTFDPVHHGHLVAGSEVAHIFALDEVIFVPTGEPVWYLVPDGVVQYIAKRDLYARTAG
jgi:nicotinic acid mononucleotide adenylyltransferase